MTDNKYEKLERMRSDIQRDRDKVARLLERIKAKEERLKEAEAMRIVADVEEVKMSPEELGAFLRLVRAGKLEAVLNGSAAEAKTDEEEEQEDEE